MNQSNLQMEVDRPLDFKLELETQFDFTDLLSTCRFEQQRKIASPWEIWLERAK